MKPESEADDLLHGLMREIGRLEKIQKDTEGESQAAKPPGKAGAIPFQHVREPAAGDQNPAFAKGVEYALVQSDCEWESLNPSHFPAVPEVEKDSLVAVRDGRRKSRLSPGVNIHSHIVDGMEQYQAKVRGRVIVIAGSIHVLPSDMDCRLVARTEDGNLSAYLDIYPAYGRRPMPDLGGVIAFLEGKDIRYGIREKTILEALETCALEGKPVLNILVAKGFPPLQGKAGSIEYFFDRDFQGPAPLELDDTGKIDFRNVKWVPVVKKDQLLARVQPTVPGTVGMEVSGRALPAKPIKNVYLVAGRNVRADKRETEFYSEINGCVQLNGSLLDVMNVFVVNSDVDFHTGNVRFDGNILVTGHVHKGFEVEAEGDVVILKNAEPCRIKAGRDIHVKGGVLGAGKGKYSLEAGRDINVGYAENAFMEAQRNIIIDNFSLQSFLYCSGQILLEKQRGSIVGGEAMAAKGVQAKVLGTSSGIKTHVAAGVDYALKRQLASLTSREEEMKEAMAKIDHFLRSLLALSGKGALHPSKAQALKEVVEKRKQLAKAFTAITTRRQELDFQQENMEPGRVKATEAAYSEVYINIRGRTIKVTETFYRSLFRLDEKTGQILRGPA